MKKVVLTYGLISGIIAAGFLWTSVLLWERGHLRFDNFDYGVVIGYAAMLISLSMVFFGIRSYRDNQAGGSVGFWKALQVGLLISLIAGVMYAAGWELYMQRNPGFFERYTEAYIEKMKVKGTPQQQIDEAAQSMASMQELYQNPAFRFGLTLLEILPVGVIVSLLSAAVLRRKLERLVEQPA